MDTLRTTRESLIDSLYVVFKRKFKILLFFGATVCTVGIATFFIKPAYEASSQIFARIGRENLYVPTMLASSNVNPVINFNREEQVNYLKGLLILTSPLSLIIPISGPVYQFGNEGVRQ